MRCESLTGCAFSPQTIPGRQVCSEALDILRLRSGSRSHPGSLPVSVCPCSQDSRVLWYSLFPEMADTQSVRETAVAQRLAG
jgi:hypothetical protein